jgi:hypothetical protein
LSSALIERIFDGIFLVACMFVTVQLVPGLPGYLIDGTIVLAVVVAAGRCCSALRCSTSSMRTRRSRREEVARAHAG